MGGRATAPMYDRGGNVGGRATAPMCCRWDSVGGHYRWWQLNDDGLDDHAGPPAGLLVIFCGVDMGPLAMAMPENGSKFAPAMGLDVAVWRSGSDRYGYESELEAMWPSNGV